MIIRGDSSILKIINEKNIEGKFDMMLLNKWIIAKTYYAII